MSGSATSGTYVLGTGLSHDGSTVLLHDGAVAVGIEKERLTRQKHDGGNDTEAVEYCLDAVGIGIDDLDLVVQCGLFERPDRNHHEGPRPFAGHPNLPVVTISHHLAHAYSAVGTCPFDEFDVLVVDGCGSPRDDCLDEAPLPAGVERPDGQLAEKDSWYRWDGSQLHPLWKDFSEPEVPWLHDVRLPTTRHSIGGFYSAISRHCFGSISDAGKLMGLAPYSTTPALDVDAFRWDADRLLVTDDWKHRLGPKARDDGDLAARFDHFADLARWAQDQVEESVCDLVRRRRATFGRRPLAYTGGVALNAVANGRLLAEGIVDDLYLEPAAGDNGIALGCAFYGWLAVLGGTLGHHDGSTCFGRAYDSAEIDRALATLPPTCTVAVAADNRDLVDRTAAHLAAGAVVGWFQDGSEFGPRALGRRSILAHPGTSGMRDHINRAVKCREDYRPFAPAMRTEDVDRYVVHGHDSPYMILVDEVRAQWVDRLANVVHADGSARVQTVERSWNPRFHELIGAFEARAGVGVLLNTSFNRRGQPIVETPIEAVDLFLTSAIDVLVLGDRVVTTR